MAVERLYAWIRTAFGNHEFTLWDFRATFPSPNPTKIISDLARRGYRRTFGMIRWTRSHFSFPVTKSFSMSTIRSAYRIGFPRSGLRRAGDKPSATALRTRII